MDPPDVSGGEVLHIIARRPWCDTSGVAMWLTQNVERWLAGEHNADEQIKTTHTHFMLVLLKTTEQSVRNVFANYGLKGRGQICFMWKTEKEPREYYSERLLGRYICKGDVNVSRGFGGYVQDDIDRFIREWKGFIKRVVSDNKSQERKLVVALTREETPKRPDMWEQIRIAWLEVPIEKSREFKPAQIVSFINSMYLRKGNPIPRSADSFRWAKSLWYLTKVNFQEELLTHEFVEKFSVQANEIV